MGFASGFASGVMIGRGLVDTYRESERAGKQKDTEAELKKIADAAPEIKAVPADPNADPSAPSTPGVVSSFLGKDYAGTPDEETQTRARQLAQAGVFEKFGDVERGGRMRDRVAQGDLVANTLKRQGIQDSRDAIRFDWEKRNQAVQAEQQRLDKEYKDGQQKIYGETTYGKRAAEYASRLDQFHKDDAAYKARVDAGDTTAVRPAPPTMEVVTPGAAARDMVSLIAHDVAYGKQPPTALIQYEQVRQKIEEEGYGKVLDLAQNGIDTPTTQIIEAFNKDGAVKIDPAAVVSDKRVDRGNGKTSRLITIKRPDGSLQTIDTLSELESLGQADKIYQRAHQDAALKLDQARTGASIAASLASVEHSKAATEEIKAKTEDRRELTIVHDALSAAIDSGDKKEEAKARAKLTSYMGSGKATHLSAFESKVNLLVASGYAKDMNEAVKLANQKVQPSPLEIMVKFQTGAMPLSDDQLDKSMTVAFGPDWKAQVRGESRPAAGGAAAPTDADVTATAKKHGITEAEVRRRLGLPAGKDW